MVILSFAYLLSLISLKSNLYLQLKALLAFLAHVSCLKEQQAGENKT